MRDKRKNVYRCMIVCAMFALLMMSSLSAAFMQKVTNQLKQQDKESWENRISVTIPIASYEIALNDQTSEISINGFGRIPTPGCPDLPSRIFSIAIPPGAQFLSLQYKVNKERILEGSHDIAPVPLTQVIGEEKQGLLAQRQREYDTQYTQVYGSDAAYPASAVEYVRSSGYRKYNLIDIRVNPIRYQPLSGILTYYPEITIDVFYQFPKRSVTMINDHLERTETIAHDIIFNYDEAQTWYPPEKSLLQGTHDYVIITLGSLTSSVTPLVDWETIKGRNVEVVTTSWIASNYAGYDLAEKIRNFLRDKYPSDEWGIEDVLLVGHYDDVPMRRCWQDVGYGKPETDFYYAELSLADSASWDADGDHQWGEDSDPIDFYNEVNVGRIPWSSASTVASICQKSVAYEQNEELSYKKNILLLGAFFWDNDPNPRTDNAVLMEAKVDQPWMENWTMTRMYEQGYSTYPMDYDLTYNNVRDIWSAGTYAFVNWAGHGSETECVRYHPSMTDFVNTQTCNYLNDAYPAIIFANACSNSDTDYLNLGQAMLQRGAVGFVGATKVAFGCPGWDNPYDGSGQSLDYFFTTFVTSGDYTQGQAHQTALRNMYTYGLWDYQKYETFEWGALWGNPDLGMGPPPFIRILLPDDLPEYIEPGIATPITVQMYEGVEQYVPDSGMLHYRYNGGEWQTTTWEPLGGDLFQAVLPGGYCGDLPEYYFSAEGTTSGIVTNPTNAPDDLYTATVGTYITVIADDFETDQGWIVENIGVMSGSWECGVPVGGGDRGDPPTDFDGSGQCYLTGNQDGNSDVDGGPTRLISPTFDLSGAVDPLLQYARWFTNDDLDQDRLIVEISNDNGASWILIESVPDTHGWVKRTIHIADYVSLTSQVKVRFSVADVPNNSVTEAAIDDVKIFYTECNMFFTVDGQVFEDDGETPALNPEVTVVNLNTAESWQAVVGTDSSVYSVVLTSGDDVNVGDVLRVIARNQTSANISVTENTVTQSQMNAHGVTIDMVLDVYYLDLSDFPMYPAQSPYHEMCGPAVAQMTLNYLWWNRTQDPSGPPMIFDNQQLLYDTGHANNTNQSLPYLDTQGMWNLIQYRKPMPYTTYGYNFFKNANTDQTFMLKQICLWINYTVGTYGGHKPGHPSNVPALVPTYGDYSNWMAVRGIHTNNSAYPLPSALTVYGFWVNDPYPGIGGLGENSYKTIDQWTTQYYLPLVSSDIYNGKYVAICDPPESTQECNLKYAQSPAQFTTEQKQLIALTQNSAAKASPDLIIQANQCTIKAAIDGVNQQLLPQDTEFATIFKDTIASTPLFVQNLNGDNYYIVSFTRATTDQTVAVVLINANDGSFKEASWTQEPVKYLPISKDDAQKLVLQTIKMVKGNTETQQIITSELVYRGSSPYYPEWRISINDHTYFVNQQGELIE
ncbi:MAG: C25 family cysteine peptidase [Euryarchaeota archaeon]|nr:C25 family cysteine peptidase [Euryarchaeota archaeon]